MREGWTYKKLTEVCKVLYGYPFDSQCFTNDSNYMPLIRIRDVQKGYSDTFYSGEIPEGYEICEGDYLVGMDGEFNIGRWGKRPGLLNQRVCKMTSSSEMLINQYMFYFLKVCLKKIEAETPFVTVKHLSAKRINQIQIPLPPIPQQRLIVSELDEINSLLALKREQLKKYDELAQSLFYEMFGDPVENEKGWEVKKLGDVCKFSQGMQVPIELQKIEKGESDVRFLRIIDFTQGREAPRYINKYDKKCYITNNDVAIVRYGTPGFVCFGKEGVIANNLFRIIPLQGCFISVFLVSWINSPAFQNKVKGNQYGAALQAIKFSTISSIPIILPPLSLQRLFAQRIEQIEEQKKQITASIAKLETLLASRMQYWFE